MTDNGNGEDKTRLERMGEAVDSVIRTFAPGWYESRQKARLRSQGYEALQEGVFDQSMYNMGGSGDRFANPTQLKRLRRTGRGLLRNNFLVGGLTEFWITQIVGDGPQLSVETSDNRFNREAENRMSRWLEVKCDVRHQHTMTDLLRLSLKTLAGAGGMVFGQGRGGKLTYAEPEQIVNPRGDENVPEGRRVWNGVEVNRDGAAQAYHIAPWDKRGRRPDKTQTVRWSARKAWHLYNPMRFSQSRGVPILTPMMVLAKHGKDFLDTEVIRAQVAACFSVLRKTGHPGEVARGGRELAGRSADDEDDDRPEVEENIRPGGIIDLMAGQDEDVEVLDPSTPVSSVGDFLGTLSRFSMFVLGLPLESLFFTDATYSGGRLARLVAQRQFKFWQKYLRDHLLRPVYRWKILQWMNMDARSSWWGIRPPEGESSPFDHRWYMPKWPWVDPKKEQGANQIGRMIGDTTLPELIRKQGRDPERVTQEKINFIEYCKQQAREHPELDEDDWKILYQGILSFKPQPAPTVSGDES